MTQSKHTQTPWRLFENYVPFEADYFYITGGEKTVPICSVSYTKNLESEANAAFIVKAVNCHDELVKQLQDMYDFIIDRDYSDEESDGMKQAAAILAKARGQS